MRKSARRAAVVLLLLAAVHAPAAAFAGDPIALNVRTIERFGIARETTRFGALEFLGGIDLTSRDRRFGGLSGIEIDAEGRTVTMVSDDGYVVRGNLAYEDGTLSGLNDARIRPLFDDPRSKHEADAEDIALDPADPSRGLIAMERRATPLLSFRLDDGWPADLEPVDVPEAARNLRYNRGLESVAYAPAGSPLAGRAVIVAERARDGGSETVPGWILGGGSFAIRRRDAFDVTSARFLPDGDLLILERRFTPISGVAMRIRRIDGSAIRDGAELDGEVLVEAGMTEQIDNMEGLAVHEDRDGRVVLTIVSDDNKSILQRTLILQFALADD
ncbi:esterase-like activity of phytase family protein [Faunimonas sp. B44]|uniref:esterase-like activity of phytase family protein n=1 Tax=Faunimonas sp. B44 TaxID=3461493 RepID=UPI004043AE8D